MRLVIRYHKSDGFTYSCTVVLPVEYKSAEKFIVDFDELVIAPHFKNGKFIQPDWDGGRVTFGGHEWDIRDFVETNYENQQYAEIPQIMTLDQWFKECEE